MDDFILFSGTANPKLADAIAHELGIALGEAKVQHFPDGETTVQISESVRRKSVFVVQSTSPPVNDNLIELLAYADACRRAGAAEIVAIVPYFGYSRADKRHNRCEPISASMVADLMQAVGITQVITLDLHSPQIEGFFYRPVMTLSAVSTLVDAIAPHLSQGTIVISPDAGRVKMATRYALSLDTSVAVLHKHRESGTQTEVTRVVGEVRDRPCLLIDDMISTGGTIRNSVQALLDAGARPEMTVVVTHGLFTDGAREKLSHEAIKSIFVTDTIARECHENWSNLQVISVAPLLAEAVRKLMG